MFTKFVVGVNVFAFSRSGHFILGKRKGSYDSGTMGLPGGHLELGETFQQCSARELLEETGIDVSPDRFTVLTATNDLEDPDGLHYITIFTGCVLPTGFGNDEKTAQQPENLEPNKCEGWQWWTWDAMTSLGVVNELSSSGAEKRRDIDAQASLSEPLRNLVAQTSGLRPSFEQSPFHSEGESPVPSTNHRVRFMFHV